MELNKIQSTFIQSILPSIKLIATTHLQPANRQKWGESSVILAYWPEMWKPLSLSLEAKRHEDAKSCRIYIRFLSIWLLIFFRQNSGVPTASSARINKILHQVFTDWMKVRSCVKSFYRYNLQTKIKFFRIHERCSRMISFQNRVQK